TVIPRGLRPRTSSASGSLAVARPPRLARCARSPVLLLPVEGTGLLVAVIAGWIGTACVEDELADLPRILAAGQVLDPRGDRDPPGTNGVDRLDDVLRRQPAGEDHAAVDRCALGQRPVEDLAGTGCVRVDEDGVGTEVVGAFERRVAGRERLDHERHPLAD